MASLTTGAGLMAATPAFADCGGAKTSIINCSQKAGAKNAGLLAAAIIALHDERVAKALEDFRAKQTASVAVTPI